MQVTQRFPPDVLAEIDQTDEVQIEPRAPGGQPTPPVVIWVVVDGQDVYVRSYRGPKGRWYKALIDNPYGILHVGQREIPFRAIHVDDAQAIAKVSDAFRRKYEHKWPKETAAMLVDDVLPTTLQLEPVAS